MTTTCKHIVADLFKEFCQLYNLSNEPGADNRVWLGKRKEGYKILTGNSVTFLRDEDMKPIIFYAYLKGLIDAKKVPAIKPVEVKPAEPLTDYGSTQ
jgi:hypothetical protein